MLPKFSKIPVSSAPEWMCNLQKTKFLKYAEMKENNFQFVFGTMIAARARYEFTILFYTLFVGMGRTSFVAMDQTNGNLYLIKYWEDHTESSTYAIESAELLDKQRFAKIIDDYNSKIPGIKSIYGDFYNCNWNEFLNIPPIQVIKAFYLAISFSKDGKKKLLHFIGDRPLPICYSCSIDEYDNWKTKHSYMLDDLIYLNELMGGKFYSAKKALGFSLERIKSFNHLRDKIFKEADISESNEGNVEIIFIRNGLLQYKKNASNISIENTVLEMFNLLEYEND